MYLNKRRRLVSNCDYEAEPMTGRRLWALVALLLALAALVIAIATAIADFPKGLTVLACLAVAVCAGA